MKVEVNPRHLRPCGSAAVLTAALLTAALWAASPAWAQQPTQPPQGTVQGVQRIPVDSVVVFGASRVKTADVRTVFGITNGDTITYRDIERGIKRLYASGQYKDVQVFARGGATTGTPVTLVLQLEEEPYVSGVEVHGLVHVGAGALEDSSGVKNGGAYNPQKVAEAEARVRRQLSQKGYQVRKIEHKLEPMPGKTNEYRLVFDVDEGGRVAIADVGFEGNKVFDAGDLKGAMATKPEGFFWFRQGNYDEDKLRKDVRENIPAYYAAHGYIDAAVTGDTLVVDPVTGKGKLILKISEGPQYRLAGFEVRGNHHFPTEELKKYFTQEKGGLLSGLGLGGSRDTTIFDQEAFDKATEKVQQLYSNDGYLYARIEPVINRDTAQGHEVVNVAWEVTEGQPAYVNKVMIAGNTFTHERIIRKQVLLLPGDVYSEDRLIQSYRNISNLGFFDSPMPAPKIDPDDKGDVNITFNVKEKQTGSINFGTAVGGGTGVAGFLGYDQPNLFGQAKSGHLRWEFGKYSNDLEASYTDPTVLDSDISGTFSLFSARDRFFTFSEGQRRRTGGSFRFGLPMPTDRTGRTVLFVGYSLARTTYEKFEDQNSALFSLPPGIQSTISFDLVRNTLDSPIFPTAGTKQEFQADLNGGPLGGDANFQKYQVTGQWYVPVGQLGGSGLGSGGVRFALGLTAQAGWLFGNASRFPFERFWMGGVQFGLPLRGYDETTITPTGYIARCNATAGCPPLEDRLGDSYMRLSAEYAARISSNLSLSLFYDAGGLYRTPREFDPTRLMRGAGIGASIVTPFGPLGFDYAYGFDKDKPGWQLHFKFGQGF